MSVPQIPETGRPRPEELQGIAVSIEGKEDLTVRPRQGAPRRPSPQSLPADLAGIAITVEGPEDLTIQPRKRNSS